MTTSTQHPPEGLQDRIEQLSDEQPAPQPVPRAPRFLGGRKPFYVSPCLNGSFVVTMYHENGDRELVGISNAAEFQSWIGEHYDYGTDQIDEPDRARQSVIPMFGSRR